LALLAITYSYNSQAISLNESLALAIENNPMFKTLQENFKQSTEIYSSAIADNFMPRFSASLSWQSDIDGSNTKINQNGSAVTASLPLFNGGAGLASLKRANLVVINNKYDFYTKEQAKILDCVNNYLQYHFEKETYELQIKAVEAFTRTYQSAQEKFKLGEETNTEVSLAKSELAKAEVRRLDSLAAYNNSKEKFINDFNVEPDSTNLPILEKLPFSNMDDFLKTVLSKNFDILTATNSIKLTKVTKYVTVAQNFSPNVSIQAQRATGISDSFSNSLSDMFNTNKANTFLSFNVSIPILSNGGKEFADIRKANSQARSAVSSLESTKDSVKSTAINLWEKYSIAKQKVEAQKQVFEAKTLVCEGTKEEYALGTKSMVDFLNAQNQMYNAAIEYKKSEVDYVFAYYKIQELLGALTSKELNLNVKVFSPEKEFTKRKRRIIF